MNGDKYYNIGDKYYNIIDQYNKLDKLNKKSLKSIYFGSNSILEFK